ncbi:MAG: orotate phosphoribosyltransferase [Lentisphaeria bacterium]|nr:orotate phosphoribosyltransferase [Lentisphaeria bacterium]
MAQYKKDFIDLMLEAEVLRFGEFETKSGRLSPYFINSGNFKHGKTISRLGHFYAEAILEQFGEGFDNLYGPAYKGIPLATITAAQLYEKFDKSVSYTFNRKEVKDHGEGGSLVGYTYTGGERIIIIEDVITAGTSIRESVPLLKSVADVTISAVVVSVDRQEKGAGDKSALEEIAELYDLQAFSIVNLSEIVDYLGAEGVLNDEQLDAIAKYRNKYGL